MSETGDYPRDDELKRIAAWPLTDWPGMMEFVHSLWWMPGWGWQEFADPANGNRWWILATGGWSGNESLIEAMQANAIPWMVHWEWTRRGGQYAFCERKENA
jgi:hypothetical protein